MFSLKRFRMVVASVLATVPLAAFAGNTEEGIAQVVSQRLGNLPMKITKSQFAELYEIDTPRGLAYTDKDGSFLVFNAVFVDTKTGANLSEKRLNELGAFKFSDLPFADAIKTVRGNGSRVLVSIEDPNCGYCKRSQQELAKLNNVTVYTFLYPILGEDSVQKSKAIWCAGNRAAMWTDYMRNGKPLPQKADCATPIERNIALGQRLRITGTPALLFPSGERIPGLASAEQIEAKFAAKK